MRLFVALLEEWTTEMKHSHPIGIEEKAGTICFALPHGRDEKTQHQHSSRRKAEPAAANLQLHS
jgi:hypothetical protein